MAVLEKMLAVKKGLLTRGISKTGKNKNQGYNFRGIDDTLAIVDELHCEHGLLCKPVGTKEKTIVPMKDGKTIHVLLELMWEFVDASDGSRERVDGIVGEGRDSYDKAVNKATTSSYKNLIFYTYVIPIEGKGEGGDPRTDSETEDVPNNPPETPLEDLGKNTLNNFDEKLWSKNGQKLTNLERTYCTGTMTKIKSHLDGTRPLEEDMKIALDKVQHFQKCVGHVGDKLSSDRQKEIGNLVSQFHDHVMGG